MADDLHGDLMRAFKLIDEQPYRPDPPPILTARSKRVYDLLVSLGWDLSRLGEAEKLLRDHPDFDASPGDGLAEGSDG